VLKLRVGAAGIFSDCREVILVMVTVDARCRRGPLIGATAVRIQARAIKLRCRPLVVAAQRLFPKSQYRCKSPSLVLVLRVFLHHAIATPSLKAKWRVILVIVEAMERYTVG
jgi:hypothetical protein